MRERAFERIGHLYPKAKLPDGSEATVIAWLWARTIPCPNRECGIDMPLMRTFQATKKKGNEHWIRPVVDRDANTVSFIVQDHGDGVPTESTVSRNGAICIACGSATTLEYVREQGKAGHIGERMTAVVAEGGRRRLFVSPNAEHIQAAQNAEPAWRPVGQLPSQARSISPQLYGLEEWRDLFTQRQLMALTTMSDLLTEVHDLLSSHGASPEYAKAVITYLAFTIARGADAWASFTVWQNVGDKVAHVFGRQGIPMIWDFAEANVFSDSTQNWMAQIDWVSKAVAQLPAIANVGEAYQADASTTILAQGGPVIVTDPPYYDNIHYADSADFFYVWHRQTLRDLYPDLFAGILSPKDDEMVANRFRSSNPRERFEELLERTLSLIRERCSPEFPSSIFYAYKQQEEERGGRTSTGWETMLSALIRAGFQIVGTWPMRTERTGRPNANQANSLASSVVLVCRPRPDGVSVGTRREFLNTLNKALPSALDHLTRDSHIAPVDLAQAAIGPGMEVYSRYSSVETISGEPVTVKEALAEINQAIAEYHQQQTGELDEATRFCLDWLEEHEYSEGAYGDAEVLSQAKNVSVDALAAAGLLRSRRGRVKLTRMEEYDHSPKASSLLGMTAWEGCLRIAWHLGSGEGRRGASGAAQVARAMGSNAESVERLARILYNYYDRRGDSRNAVLFNTVVVEWPSIMRAVDDPEQGRMLGRT